MSEVPLYRVVRHRDCPMTMPHTARRMGIDASPVAYRGTSLTRKRTPLGPYHRPMSRVLGGS